MGAKILFKFSSRCGFVLHAENGFSSSTCKWWRSSWTSSREKSMISASYFHYNSQQVPSVGLYDKYTPKWFENRPFEHNMRCLLGFIPGAILIGVVLGHTLVNNYIIYISYRNQFVYRRGYSCMIIKLIAYST